MSARTLVALVVSSTLFAARLPVASAAVGAFALSAPANGGFVGAAPTLVWQASAGASSYTLTITPATGAPLVKSGLSGTSYAIAAGDALSEASSPYTWKVTARDADGNTRDSNSASFFVDTTPPSSFGLTAPADQAFASDQNARFTWQASSDSGSGISKYHFYVDGVLCGDATAAGFAFLPSTCNPADGTHSWAVSAEDVAGNVRFCNEAPAGSGGRVLRIDNIGPGTIASGAIFNVASADTPDQYGSPTDHMVDTGINVLPGDQISITSSGTWCFLSCTSGCFDTTGFDEIGSPATQSCTPGSLIARVGGGTSFKCIGRSASFTAGINDSGILEIGSNSSLSGCGTNTVTATVNGGRTFGLIDPPSGAVLDNQFPAFSWQSAPDEGSGGVTYELDIDGTQTSVAMTGSGSTYSSDPISTRLSDGAHTWRVRARDLVGNVTDSTTWSFTVDTTRPASFRLRSPGNQSCSMTPTPSLCWNVPNDPGGLAKIDLYIDDAIAFSTTDSILLCGTPSVALGPGEHSWYAVATDRAGNARRSTDTFSILIDYTAPTAPALVSPADGASSADPPAFAWSAASDAGGVSKYEIYVDGTLAATVGADASGWLPPVDLSPGAHSWYVRAVDSCGQGTPSAARGFTVVACTPDGAQHPCPGYDAGPCRPGTRTCTSVGQWSACADAVKPAAESCNGVDDDCNGVVDDGTNSCGGVCTLPFYLYTPCDGPDSDSCAEGVYLCTGLNSMECVETTPNNVEVCNGRDDDCNNVVDDGAVCTSSGTPDAGSPVEAGTRADGGARSDGGAQPDGSAVAEGGGRDASAVSPEAGDAAGLDDSPRADAAGIGPDGALGTSGSSSGGSSGGGETSGETGSNGVTGSPEAGARDAAAGSTGALLADGGRASGSAGETGGSEPSDDASGPWSGGNGDSSNSGCACTTATRTSGSSAQWSMLLGVALTAMRRSRGRRRRVRPVASDPPSA